MKKLLMVSGVIVLALAAVPAWSETTVKVDNDKVTVSQNGGPATTVTTTPGTATTVSTPVVATAVTPVTTVPSVAIEKVDLKDFEGKIEKVDMPDSVITVHDNKTDRDRRVLVKQGWIDNYKVGDYVRIHLMNDMYEAKDIQTIR